MIARAKLATVVAGLLIVGSMVLPAMAASASKPRGAPIKIGVVCSCTGPAGSSFSLIQKALQASLSALNATGGINNHPLVAVLENDQTNPALLTTEVQTLVSDQVVAVVDLSLLDNIFLPTLANANIPVIANADQASLNPDMFVAGTTVNNDGIEDVDLAKAAHATKIALLTLPDIPQSAQELPQINAAIKQNPSVSIVYQIATSLTQTDFSADCIAAKQAGATGLIAIEAPPNLIDAATDCNRQGYNPVWLAGALSPTEAATPGLKNAWGNFGIYPYFLTKNPQVKKFIDAMNKYSPGILSNANASPTIDELMWTSTIMLKDALVKANLGSKATPTAGLALKGLYELKGDTIGGLTPPLTFKRGQAHYVNCWYQGRYINGTPHVLNNAKLVCAK